MIFYLSLYARDHIFSFFNVFHYVSFRAMAALLSSLGMSLWLGHKFIVYYGHLFSANARLYTPELHQVKNGIPTMGGLFIIASILISCLLWCDLRDQQVLIALWSLVGFGTIGAIDDRFKITHKAGISASRKFLAQCVVALIAVGWFLFSGGSTLITMPFFKTVQPDIGYLGFFIWSIFIIVGCSNAVNLTDGLDGLAAGLLVGTYSTFSIISYLAGHAVIAIYLCIPWVKTAELSIVGASVIGSLLGFLWYNAYPAQVFMGDIGSLALGAMLAMIAIMTKHELLLAVAGGLFVIETLSVVLQVLSYRFRGVRLFRMAPMHHHFELAGWSEAKITVRFSIVTFVLCMLALMTLKIR